MARGGKREGSGRPKGSKGTHTLQAEAYRKALIEAVLKEKEPIIRALIKRGMKGDVLAIKEINDRVLGKSVQPVSGPEGDALFGELTDALRRLASRK